MRNARRSAKRRRKSIQTALKAANLIGDGLYGVDLKEVGNQPYIIEVNDNPSIDTGYEDMVLKSALYREIMSVFLQRIEAQEARAIADVSEFRSAFSVFGIEIEYMIVDRTTLDVAPMADRLLTAAAGELTEETEQGEIAWSNELALHVIEVKTNGPRPRLEAVVGGFPGRRAPDQRAARAHGMRA